MDLLIPLVWATNLTLIGYFLLKLRRDFELSAKRKAFEEDRKERLRLARQARKVQQHNTVNDTAVDSLDSLDASQQNPV
ncbi:MAG: hypothetical protein ACO3WO_02155 [Burkholderiaceae bacterium]